PRPGHVRPSAVPGRPDLRHLARDDPRGRGQDARGQSGTRPGPVPARPEAGGGRRGGARTRPTALGPRTPAGPVAGGPPRAGPPAVSKARKAVEALQHGAGGKGGEGDLVLPIAPVFSRALGRAAAMLRQKPAWALNQSEIIELFRQVTRVHPDGMIHYFLGT